MAFDDAAVDAIFDKVVSHAMTLGKFETVNTHEPKSSPQQGIALAVWVQSIEPIRSSGLAAVSGRIVLQIRAYTSMLQQPYDAIDPSMVKAVNQLLSAYSGDFDLNPGSGATVRAIDIFGMEGIPMSSQSGYVEIDKRVYRVITVTLPIIINDLWTEAG